VTQHLELRSITAHYGTTKVLEDLSLAVGAGELVSLLGASGCGKTTTLRLVAGFLAPTAGTITLSGRDLTRLPAYKRDIGLVFQNYALFPHLSVLDNVAFGLKQRGLAADARQTRAMAILERVGLAALSDRAPGALSGGQKQRVALARALVIEPPLLMFDEPLSNLDAKLRVDMRVEIRQLQQSNGTTSVYVTHDQEEAFSISDRVAIMNAGRVMQFDRPEVLYRRPANTFVARFVGSRTSSPSRSLPAMATPSSRRRPGRPSGCRRRPMAPSPMPSSWPRGPTGSPCRPIPAPWAFPRPSASEPISAAPTSTGARRRWGPWWRTGRFSMPFEPGSTARLVPVPEQCAILAPEGVA
jgi:putative spermidine/putrescine transport system ATP-binding protein